MSSDAEPAPVGRAITVGIPEFAIANTELDEDADALEDLPLARPLTDEIGAALTRLGYQTTVHNSGLTSAELDEIVRTELRSTASGPVIVHVLSHSLQGGGLPKLLVLGKDGQATADVAQWLDRLQGQERAPYVLFLLDLCHSGSMARMPWQLEALDCNTLSWVIAACRPDEKAAEGRFTEALINVLDQVAQGLYGIDPDLPHVPLNKIAQAVGQEVARLTPPGHYRQAVTATVVDISCPPEEPGFFRNREHSQDGAERRGLRAAVDPDLSSFLAEVDEGLDPRHFVERALGLGPLRPHAAAGGRLVCCFRGRDHELRELSAWANGRGGQRLAVVTGSAGVGKSALLGILVCALHPKLSEPTKPIWSSVARAPYPLEEGEFAAIHVHGRTTASVTASLARQLGLPEDLSPATLIEQIAALPGQPVLVLDALDEAEDAAELIAMFLLPLVEALKARKDTRARVLLGVRKYTQFQPLLDIAEAAKALFDLDSVPENVLQDHLSQYVIELLRATDQ